MKIFVTGISTDVGKTIVSSILTEALQADYWKPVQTGDVSDSEAVLKYISNSKTKIHSNAYHFDLPASPHASAKVANSVIETAKIKEPETENHLVIEGAGGILVPLNDTDCIIDLIKPDYKVIVVSRHYLGSINHTLLTIEALKSRNINVVGIIFSGTKNEDSESIILQKTNINCLGCIDEEPYFDKNVVAEYAAIFEPILNALV